MILADSNVLIDVVSRDPLWFDWTFARIGEASGIGQIVVNPVVVAEVAPRLGSFEAFSAFLATMLIEMQPLDSDAGFRAGMAYQRYLAGRRGRMPASPKAILADFLIGGHAQAIGAAILTRDPRRYRVYFPDVPLITPERTDND